MNKNYGGHQGRRLWSWCRRDRGDNRKTRLPLWICGCYGGGGADPSKSWNTETDSDLRICVPGSVCGYDQSGHPSDRIYQRDGRKAFRCGSKYRQGLQDSFCNRYRNEPDRLSGYGRSSG